VMWRRKCYTRDRKVRTIQVSIESQKSRVESVNEV
jgi:hypothetical protein